MAGMETVVIANPSSGKPISTDHLFKHCPYCASHAFLSLPLPAAQFVFAVLDASPSYPPLFYQSVAPLFSWTAAKPRGPPALI